MVNRSIMYSSIYSLLFQQSIIGYTTHSPRIFKRQAQELGLAGFALGNGVQATGTGIWSLGMGQNVNNQKWEWDLRITKWDLERK